MRTRTIIQKDSSNIIKGFVERAENLTLNHPGTEGQLKELFLGNVLKLFLSQQFDIGSGIITNHNGTESSQADIIIYDRRMIPPFIYQGNVGAYPVESVLAVIEVKSTLSPNSKNGFKKIGKDASKLDDIYKKCTFFERSKFNSDSPRPPFFAVFSLKENMPKLLHKNNKKACNWLDKKSRYISSVCIVGKYSWIRMGPPAYPKVGWKFQKGINRIYEETKRFIAVLLDNVRTTAEKRLKFSIEEHRDWLSQYIRDQS
ncbi:MAG: hypothetical protein G01um101430_510 [Parcubacteria group bacterium Gr01-1014_30]|nr:MAG: hypothetical protein G01um101430_510 [Parcubacteria group bacterium Gr01-1014_30]